MACQRPSAFSCLGNIFAPGILPSFFLSKISISLNFLNFSGSSNTGSGRRASRASQDNGPPPQGQLPILGVDFVISDATLRSEVHQAQAILTSLRGRISDAEQQLQEYGERMEGLG